MMVEKLTFEEKQRRVKEKRLKKIASAPILAMATYEMAKEKSDEFDLPAFRLQVIKLSGRSCTMRTINGRGTVTISLKKGESGTLENFSDFLKIEKLPCNTTPGLVWRDGRYKEIPQGSDVPL